MDAASPRLMETKRRFIRMTLGHEDLIIGLKYDFSGVLLGVDEMIKREMNEILDYHLNRRGVDKRDLIRLLGDEYREFEREFFNMTVKYYDDVVKMVFRDVDIDRLVWCWQAGHDIMCKFTEEFYELLEEAVIYAVNKAFIDMVRKLNDLLMDYFYEEGRDVDLKNKDGGV
ncbi:MAG: hypothetical protein QXK45_05645 [Thermofilaceae archaeon]